MTGDYNESGQAPCVSGLIEQLDWAGTAFGPRNDWTAELRVTVQIMLASPVPMALLWGQDGTLIYNDGYAEICGPRHPEALGASVLKVWPEAERFNADVLAVGFAGKTARFEEQELELWRHGRPERVWMDLDYVPVTDRNGRPLGVLATVFDHTQRRLAEQRLAESEKLFRFLDRLAREVSPLSDAGSILEVTTRMVAGHLGLSSCAYADMDETGDGFTIRGDWHAPGSPSIIGHYHLAAFGTRAVRDLNAGRPLVINDNLSELAPHEAKAFRDISIAATICVPLVKDGKLRALMAIHDREPHHWSDEEVALIQAVTERSWAHIERSGAEAALRASEEQLRLATDAAEIGLWDVDEINGTMFWPSRVKAMFGISPDVPVSMADYYAGLHPDDFDSTAAAYAAAADPVRRALYDVEYRTIGKEDGIIRWVAAKGRGVFADDRCIRVLGTAIDISQRKATEEALLRLNETLEQRVADGIAERKLLADLVDNTDAIIQVVDTDHRLLAINHAAADAFDKVYGIRPRIGDRLIDLLSDRPEHQAEVKAIWDRILSGEDFSETAEFGDSAIDRRCFEMKNRALRDADGRTIGAYQIVYDVTDRIADQRRLAEAEEQLRQAQKVESLGQLTGGVAHDFNNLLTPIVGSLDMLSRKKTGTEREQRLIDGALQSAERARTLVQRLLAFARRQPLQPRAVDVGALIEGMRELIASTSGPQIHVAVDVAGNLPAAHGDQNQLEMALLNLAVNARDAMPDGGTLRISASEAVPDPALNLQTGNYLRISVADNGVGMDAATAARAIEPFFSTKGIGKGTGLGLSMVHGLAQQLGGTMRIASRPGVGTNVDLWLPLSTATIEAASSDRIGPDVDDQRREGLAFLVDDEPAVRASTAHMLDALGFEVTEFETAESALAALRSGSRPQLLVTDHLMPGMDGTQLVRAIRDMALAVPCLVVSGYAELDGIAPDLPRLSKPFREAELAAAVAPLVRSSTGPAA